MGISASQERYVNVYTDFAFKKLFGTEMNKELLISFLNSMFDPSELRSCRENKKCFLALCADREAAGRYRDVFLH